MNTVLLVIGSIFVVIAALFHVYIFTLESVTWSNPRTWRVFGVANQADAETIKPMAFNQGFYNLFLGITAGLGVTLLGATMPVALTLITVGAGSMVLAAVVLFSTSPVNRRSAIIQGGPPLIGLVFLLVSALVG